LREHPEIAHEIENKVRAAIGITPMAATAETAE
jgi:hypothetical protein